jgi:hypothetical protein
MMKIEDLDPFSRGMDPRIGIRIHTKMSWIRNTAYKLTKKAFILLKNIFEVFLSYSWIDKLH